MLTLSLHERGAFYCFTRPLTDFFLGFACYVRVLFGFALFVAVFVFFVCFARDTDFFPTSGKARSVVHLYIDSDDHQCP